MYRVMGYPQPVTPNAIGRHYTASHLPCRSRGLDEYRLQTPVCPLLAQSRHGDGTQRGPLSGVKRTSVTAERKSVQPRACPAPALTCSEPRMGEFGHIALSGGPKHS